ncbi:MAG: cytochrome-c peroxidase [Deltaproteobacteria bacterium]|nr:cytochrome-c peroxidase [Deltaproteobacteria bacterium]
MWVARAAPSATARASAPSERTSAPRPLAPLDPPSAPADNPTTPEKVELGKLLFFDGRLSGDTTTPCSGCHQPKLGWGDGMDLSHGYPGTHHWRNSQTVINSAYYAKLFWAGESTSLEKQAEAAATGNVAGNGAIDLMEERLRQVPEYVDRFRKVFGTERPEIGDAWRAIAAYERTLIQTGTPLDRFLRGDASALGPEAKRGKALFEGKARCIQCHDGPLTSDEKYHNIGLPPSPTYETSPLVTITFRFQNYSRGVPEEVYRKSKLDLGLYYTTARDEDMAKFRTPSLRYLKYTAPYMHNGVFKTLEEVVAFYNRGGDPDPVKTYFGHATKSPLIRPLGLSKQEQADLVAFLLGMSGDEIVVDQPKLPPYGAEK